MANAPSGIWETQLSDHFQYLIFLGIHTAKVYLPKYIETRKNDPSLITRFKHSLEEENILNCLDTIQLSDPNENYNSKTKLKDPHLPSKM